MKENHEPPHFAFRHCISADFRGFFASSMSRSKASVSPEPIVKVVAEMQARSLLASMTLLSGLIYFLRECRTALMARHLRFRARGDSGPSQSADARTRH
jgi:hypothetical protein